MPALLGRKVHVVSNSHGQAEVSDVQPRTDDNYFVTLGRVSAAKGQFEVVKALSNAGVQVDADYNRWCQP